MYVHKDCFRISELLSIRGDLFGTLSIVVLLWRLKQGARKANASVPLKGASALAYVPKVRHRRGPSLGREEMHNVGLQQH